MTEDYDTDEMLDRLIDGELSPDDRRRVLTALESSVDGWRRCALGFIEAQTWRGEMRRLVSDAISAAPAATASIAVSKHQGAEQAASRSAHNRHKLPWLAMAAGLLFAFTLGWQLHSPQGGPDLGQAIALAPPAEMPADRAELSNDAVTLVLNDSKGAQHRVDVPLVEARNLGDQFAATPGWIPSSALRRSLEAQGVDLKARRRYAPMYFEQQNQIVPMVVPVDDAIVTPVKRAVF